MSTPDAGLKPWTVPPNAVVETAGEVWTLVKLYCSTVFRSVPDSLLLGSLLLAVLTQSYTYLIVAIAMLELALAENGLSRIFSLIFGSPSAPPPDSCSLQIPSFSNLSLVGKLMHQGYFPSGPIFIASGIVSYMLSSTMDVSREIGLLKENNPVMAFRFPVSLMLGLAFLGSFFFWRVSNGCDTFLGALMSVFVGLGIGTGIFYLNKMIFGREAVNFGGLPLLVSRMNSNKPMIACAKV